MNKSITKIKNKIQEKPLEAAFCVAAAAVVVTAGYYNRSNILKLSKSDLKKLSRRPGTALLFEIKGKDYALIQIND